MALKFYLDRGATTNTGTLPATNVSLAATAPTWTPGATNGTAATPLLTNLTMDVAISTVAQTSLAYSTAAVTTNQRQPLLRFLSPPLAAQTIAAQTITLQFGGSNSNSSSSLQFTATIAVWRPSTGAIVGRLFDQSTSTAQPGTTETNVLFTIGSGSVTAVTAQLGDVLVVEIWRSATLQSMGTSYTNTVYYDGRTEGSATDNAAFIQFTNDVVLRFAQLTGTTVAQSSSTALSVLPYIQNRTATSGTGAAQSPFTITVPAGTQTGDYVIVVTGEATSQPPTAPSGWAQLGNNNAAASQGQTMFGAAYSPSLSLTLQAPAAGGVVAWVCNSYYVVSGSGGLVPRPDTTASGTGVIGGYSGGVNTQANTGIPTAPITTGAGTHDFEVLAYGWQGNQTITFTAGTTLDAQQVNGTSIGVCIGYNNTNPLPASTAAPTPNQTLSSIPTSSNKSTGALVLNYFPSAVALTPAGPTAAQATSNSLGLRFKGTRPSDAYGQAVYDDASAFTFWRMEDPSGTTLTDLMGSRNGTLVGTFLYHQGSALKSVPTAYSMGFDGSSSRVSIADIPVSGSFTVEAWAYANSWVVGAPIIDRRNTSGDIGGFSLEVADTSGRFNGYIYTSSWQGIQTYRTLAIGMWHHIVFTYNGQTGGAAIYVNGEIQAGTTLGTINNPTTATAAIGFNPSYTIYWPGYLDEIALYARPFATTDVQTHYRLGMASPWAYEQAVESDLAGLVAYWPLDEPATPNAFDESGRGHTLFEDSGCSYAALSPPGGNNPNNSLFFNNTGQSSAVRSGTDGDLMFGATEFSWEVWVYQDVATVGPILEYGNTSTSDFHIWNYPNAVDLYVNFTPALYPAGLIQAAGVLTAGVWHHVVVQREGNTGRAYVDGSKVGNDTDLTGNVTQMTTPFNLGFRQITSGPAAHYGWIDQVAVYNHSLSLTTIQSHYQLGSGAAPGGVALTGATVAQAVATGAPRVGLTANTVAQSVSTAAVRTGLTGLTVAQAISTASPSFRLAAITVAQAGFDELTAAPTIGLAATIVAQAVSAVTFKVSLPLAGLAVAQATTAVSLKTLLAAVSVAQSASVAALVIVADPIHTATSPDTSGTSTTSVGIDTTGKTLLVVGVVNANNTSTFPSYNDAATPLTDNYGNTWTRVGPTAVSGVSPWNHFAEAFYCIAPTVGPNHTFTYTTTTNTFVGLTVAGTNKV